MSSISKPDHCTERPSIVLLSAYQEYLMTFNLMTSQVVKRARPLITHICVFGIQRVNGTVAVTYWHVRISTYCILYFVYAYLSRIAHYVNLESTHIHAVCMNKQNKPIRQHTTVAVLEFLLLSTCYYLVCI